MIFETDRLILRPITQGDFDNWYEILSDAETMQHYPEPFDEAKTKRWIKWNLDNYEEYGLVYGRSNEKKTVNLSETAA